MFYCELLNGHLLGPNCIVTHTGRDRKKKGVDRETVNREVGVEGEGKWVNKHTKKRRGWFSFPENR